MKNFKRIIFAASIAAALSQLTGCGALSLGEEEFACSGMPGSVYCHSARDVYEKTNDGIVPSPVGRKDGAYNEECDDCVRAEEVNPALTVEEDENSRYALEAEGVYAANRTVEVIDRKTGERKVIRKKSLAVHDDEVINNYVAPRLPSEPVPIRTPSQVMRIWVAPYVDTNGDLVAPGFVYTEIEPRRWIYPGSEGKYGYQSKMFQPLQAGGRYGSSHRSANGGGNGRTRSDLKKGGTYSDLGSSNDENSLEKFKRAQMNK